MFDQLFSKWFCHNFFIGFIEYPSSKIVKSSEIVKLNLSVSEILANLMFSLSQSRVQPCFFSFSDKVFGEFEDLFALS